MRNSRNFNLGLIIGAAAGAAAGWLAYSQRGKEFRSNAQTKLNETSQEIKEKVTTEIDNLSSKAQEMFQNGKQTVEAEIDKLKGRAKAAANSRK